MAAQFLALADGTTGVISMVLSGDAEQFAFNIERAVAEGLRFAVTSDADLLADPTLFTLGAPNGSGGPSDLEVV